MKSLIALFLIALPLPAFADACGQWLAALEEDEGGSVMTARICTGDGKASPELFVRCGAADTLSLRYIPAASASDPEPGFHTSLQFSSGGKGASRHAQYEAMDGAMVVSFKPGDALANVLENGRELVLADAAEMVPSATFTLNGSRSAIDKVAASCGRN